MPRTPRLRRRYAGRSRARAAEQRASIVGRARCWFLRCDRSWRLRSPRCRRAPLEHRSISFFERAFGSSQQRVRRFEADVQSRGDLLRRKPLDVFPLERVAVARAGAGRARLECGVRVARVAARPPDRRRPTANESTAASASGMVLEQHDVRFAPPALAAPLRDLAAADRAQPSEELRFAAVACEVLERSR